MTSLKKLVIRGTIWTIAGYGSSQILRFGSNLILTRLLIPELFGLMAVVNTLRVGIELFSDIGISQVIVNSKRGDEQVFLNTAWTLAIIRGFAIWLFCLLLTWPMARFYNDERLLWLIPVVGLSSVIDGFASTNTHTLQRRIDLAKYTLFNLILQILGLLTLIILAYWQRNITALAMGVVLGSVYYMSGSYFLIPGKVNRFAWDQNAADEILSFGKWMFLASGMAFLNEQADRLILGKLLSFGMLGVYTVAYSLASIPREIIKTLSHRVIFPAISSQVDLPRPVLRSKVLQQRQFILLGFAIVLAILVTTGDQVIASLYDKRYKEATWMMPILCSGIWISVLFHSMNPALLAVGKAVYSAQSNLAGFLMILVGLPLAFFHFGTVGAIILIALSDSPLYIVSIFGLHKEELLGISQDILMTGFFIVILSLFIIIRYSLGFGTPIQGLI
ncbi:polysaccharide biosynthesis protein [Nostoc sp. CENA543]|uniref:oligosaccharide flippase family protein n=1 Tax=Nostoc sp. CENA543 TaxID=1869241 RepID=UPI000CA351E5|nr:oligosaccharide flippase family protein [Nostoc sp. CENA543]AUT02021.1 polysaccharide biosynthesis protein [Nostoc sp. CENA543]